MKQSARRIESPIVQAFAVYVAVALFLPDAVSAAVSLSVAVAMPAVGERWARGKGRADHTLTVALM